ncbi:MAG: hypothetical protein IPK74_09040 [Deltaproteobacteria bacterium]|nr:hypothetical protein [Deltaproteobacteria bacterium]
MLQWSASDGANVTYDVDVAHCIFEALRIHSPGLYEVNAHDGLTESQLFLEILADGSLITRHRATSDLSCDNYERWSALRPPDHFATCEASTDGNEVLACLIAAGDLTQCLGAEPTCPA